ncbi:MAG: 3-dehydroquinate synthase II [Promethearchaeota archaeon]|nr:MAG: 3-dehydroquinate synthase II [Candidatus Lokiarchaeota archaeon]
MMDMKRIILNFEKRMNDFEGLVQEAFNMNFLNFMVSKETLSEFDKIERVKTYSQDLTVPSMYKVYSSKEEIMKNVIVDDGIHENTGFYKQLTNKDDEREVIELSKTGQVDFIIVSAKDWKIIPFENLIADMHTHETDLIAEVDSVKEAELMFKTLERGVDGILITPKDANDIVELKSLVQSGFNIIITKGKVLSIQEIPEAERVCVDTASLLRPGEGMLIGSTAMGFTLVHAEVFETQFVASRPFRVNAGDVSAYILVPGKEPNSYRTNYLSDLKGGDKVIVVNTQGNARIVSVARVKIETRPMLRFELETEKEGKKIKVSCICQNAETIRLVSADGNAKSVVDIKVGDEILLHIGPGATHFGTTIKETILEK